MLRKAFSKKQMVLSIVIVLIFNLISFMGSGIGSVYASGVLYTSVEAGGMHTLALDDKGNIWAWGKNGEGELGTGNTTSSNIPTKLVVTDEGTPVQFVAVSAGAEHSVALDTKGNVWAWGFNGKGAIGTESAQANVLSPVKASITGVKAIAAGGHYTLALKSDGTVWAWGDNTYGTIGVDLGIANPFLNFTVAPVQVQYANGANLVPLTAKYIATGDNRALVIDTNDVLWSWGLNGATNAQNQLPSKVLDGSGKDFKAKAVSAGNSFYAALDLTGNVWTSGTNYGGVLGIGNTDSNYKADIPVKVTGVSNVTEIATGYAHVIVMDSAKKVWAWGLNRYCQLGNKSGTNANVPVQVKNNNGTFFVEPSAITAGGVYFDSFTVAIKSGKLISWGANNNKQLLNTDDALVSGAATKDYAEVKDAYTVTFNSQGGSAVSSLTNVVSGNKITAPTPPTKTNYFFGGWYLESSTTTPWDFAVDRVTADITLYAKWTAYTVTYDGNGYTGGSVPTDSNYYIQGANVTVQGNTGSLTRTNYSFAGWNTKADGTGTTYAANATFTMGTAHVVLYAKWVPTYTVTYDGNGSTGGSVPTDSGNYVQGATVTVKGNTGGLTLESKAFAGWNTKADGTGTSYAAGATFPMGTANTVLYAQWVTGLSVTYDGNGNTSGSVLVDSSMYAPGATVTVKGSSLVRANYKFDKWNTKADGSGTSYGVGAIFQIGATNVVLYAQWIPVYTVTYNGNDKTGGMVPTDSGNYVQGATVTVKGNIGNLTRAGYKFVNWNTKADGTGTSYIGNDTFAIGTADVVLYAQWTLAYTLTYYGNQNDGGAVPPSISQILPGTMLTIQGNTGSLKRQNYAFASWNTKADGTGTTYKQGNTITIGNENVSLYAQWAPTYTVTYKGNGNATGSAPVDTQNYSPGATVAVKVQGSLLRPGFNFVGWNTETDGSGFDYIGGSSTFKMGTANVVLYAKWSPYEVKYNGNGSTGGNVPIDSVLYAPGTTVTVLGNTGSLVRAHYTFDGWNTKADGTGTDYAAEATFTIGAAHVTLYAKWIVDPTDPADPTYTVTYNGNEHTGGSVPTDSGSYAEGATVTVAGNTGSLTRTDHTFEGWNTKADGTGTSYAVGATFQMGTADVVLYAKWTAKPVDPADPTYTVTYNGNEHTGGSVPIDNGAYEDGATVTVAGNTGNLVRTDHTFAGWNTKADGTGTDYAAGATFQMGTADVVLYAKWTAKPVDPADPTYTVTYDGNGKTGGNVPIDSGSYAEGATLTVKGNTGSLTRTDHTFAGWNTKADGTGIDYAAGATFQIGTADVVLYAKWTAKPVDPADPTYTVTYNGNGNTGGSVPTDNGAYEGGATVTVAGNTGSLTRTDHTFAGWNTKADGTGTSYAAGATFPMGTANVVLYAKWTAKPVDGNSSSGGGSGTSPTTEMITVEISAGDKGIVSKTQIERTTNSDGTKSDHVTLLPDKAMESVDKTKSAGADTVRILIPDAKDEVKEVRVDLPPQAIKTVADSGLALQIYTSNGSITIPNGSLQNMNPDLYFRIVPIKHESERKQVEERAKQEQIVKVALGDGSVKIVGRPMTIETNMSSREALITLPMDRALIPLDAKAKETFLANLVIFIEHSDGERALVRPELGDYPDGRLALTFTIQKFSTFTILNMDNWAKYIAAGHTDVKGSHKAYIKGYPDHTFKPENSLTRAEMAAILTRVIEVPQAETAIAYPDVSRKHWAKDVIAQVGQTGLMKGYPDGGFKPEGAITRAELAAIVARWMKLSGTLDHSYKDVHGHWAEQAIAQVSQAGYMTGYPDGSFQPDKALTRAEAVAVINRVLKRGPLYGTTKTWTDVANNHWALHEIEEASQDHTYAVRPEGGEEKTE